MIKRLAFWILKRKWGYHPTTQIRELIRDIQFSEWELQAIAGDCFGKMLGLRIRAIGEPSVSITYSVKGEK